MNELSKTKAKELKGLYSKKERDLTGLFMAEGEKCVKDLLKAFPLEYLICSQEWLKSNPELQRECSTQLLVSDKRGLEIISTLSSVPEVVAIFKKPEAETETPKLSAYKLYLLLDEIQDPGNLGTIIRTCDWFGVYEIFASKTTVDVYSPKVVKSTMGSLSRVKVRYLDLERLIDSNKEVPVVGTLLEGIPLNDAKLERHGMILMGNEGKGISESLKSKINVPVTIPPINPIDHPDSLNVAIATAIILSHLSN